MRVYRLAIAPVMLAAMLAAAPACAEVYKWVDQNGVANYSNKPPTDPAIVRKLMPVEDRLSVYTPDKGLEAAMKRAREQSAAADSRTDIPQGGPRVGVIGVPPPVQADSCGGRPDCDTLRAGYYPYPPAVVLPLHRRVPRFHPVLLRPGAIAGTVVGSGGFIPGNSAAAMPLGAHPARPRQAAAFRER